MTPRKYKFFILLIGFIFNFHLASASGEIPTEKISPKEEKKVKDTVPHKGSAYIIAAPVISTDPTYGLKYGVAGSFSIYMGDPKITKISSSSIAVNYSTNKQLLVSFKSTVYTNNNNCKLDLDWQYLNSSQGTYGLGTGPFSAKLASNGFDLVDKGIFSAPIPERDLLKFKLIKLHSVLTKKIAKGLYVGGGYYLDYYFDFKDNLLNLDTNPPAITSFYAYNHKYGFKQDKSWLSGISFNAIYDTRDNVNMTFDGRFANVQFLYNPTWLGSTQNSSYLWLEYRDYFHLAKNNKSILAFWAIGNFETSGRLPYMNLPSIGGDQYNNSGRGYTLGRFRGMSMVYSEIELRQNLISLKKIPNFFGITAFANMTTTSNRDADIYLFKYVDPAVGAGLMMMISPQSRLTLKLDYAMGFFGSSGLYVGVNESF